MTVAESVDVRRLLGDDSPFDVDDVATLAEVIGGPQLAEVRQELDAMAARLSSPGQASEAVLSKIGIGFYFLGRHKLADEMLAHVTASPLACFYHGLVLSALERHDEAEEQFAEAAKQGYDRVECILRKAGEIRAQARIDDAEATLRSVAPEAAGRAEYSFQMGCILADRRDTFGAVEYFERAVDMDPHHSRALFRLAAENVVHGNDDEAIRLYEQSLSKPPYYLSALLNLGLLYEDCEQYAAAAFCFRRIIQFDPNHERARLYLRDIEATSDMYYDEDSARREARMEQLLGRPVTDFELSVRSRNCLQGMNIYTLGDLTRISEQELLGGKNFGETSLHEIRDMMTAHGLSIGQNMSQGRPHDLAIQQTNLSPQEQAKLNMPISELNLSVRARKCMGRLGLASVAELVQRTPDELLSSRNFGVTSLNEIRAKLAELNLKLRND